MSDPQSAEEICSSCYWYSSLAGEVTGYCYETEVVVAAGQPACPEWDRNYPEKRQA